MDHLPTAVPSRARRRAQRAHARWLALGDRLAAWPLLPAGWLFWVAGPLAGWRARRLGARCARLEAAGRLAGLAAAHAPEPLTLDIEADTSALERVLERGRAVAQPAEFDDPAFVHPAAHDPAHLVTDDHEHGDNDRTTLYRGPGSAYHQHIYIHDHDPPGAV